MKLKLINPGTSLYLVIDDNYGSFIVPVIAEAVDDIYTHLDLTCWHYRYKNGTDELRIPTDQKDNLGWTIYETKDKFWLGDKIPVNQLIWVDEPVGHALTLGDELFLTLQEAQENAIFSRKKHLKRRLKKYRKQVQNFIASTWKVNGEFYQFRKLPNKKIYVVKG